MIIPLEKLSAQALRGILEAFVLMEGTDYGSGEFTLDDKVAAVMRQLDKGLAVVVYDERSQSCTVRVSRDLVG